MSGRVGIILLDGDEVILRIYHTNTDNSWKLLRYQSYDLASGIPGKTTTSSEFVEIIAEVLLTRYASAIIDWKICARNMEDSVVHDISTATGIATESLTLQREQELLCRGMLAEMEI